MEEHLTDMTSGYLPASEFKEWIEYVAEYHYKNYQAKAFLRIDPLLHRRDFYS